MVLETMPVAESLHLQALSHSDPLTFGPAGLRKANSGGGGSNKSLDILIAPLLQRAQPFSAPHIVLANVWAREGQSLFPFHLHGGR